MSSLKGLREVIETKGLFSSLYTDRGSYYWETEEMGGEGGQHPSDSGTPALRLLGVTLINPGSGKWSRCAAICIISLPVNLTAIALGAIHRISTSQTLKKSYEMIAVNGKNISLNRVTGKGRSRGRRCIFFCGTQGRSYE